MSPPVVTERRFPRVSSASEGAARRVCAAVRSVVTFNRPDLEVEPGGGSSEGREDPVVATEGAESG